MQLSVVIVHYWVPAHLEQCLCSLKKALERVSHEVIVVDNSPETMPQQELPLRFPWVRWIKNQNNLGFAAACNIGWKNASGEQILFLNPDTMITDSVIEKCFTALHRADAVGCRLINGRGQFLPESKRSIPGIRSAAFKVTGLSALFPSSAWWNQYARGEMPEQSAGPVDVLAGALMLVRKTTLEMMGGFDEAFFLYGEDIDFCKRMRERGLVLWYEGEEAAIHFKGASSSKKTGKYFHHFYRAMSVYVSKYYPMPIALAFQPLIFFRQWLHRLFHFVLRKFFSEAALHPAASRWLLVGDEEECSLLAGKLKSKWGQGLTISIISPEEADLLVPGYFSSTQCVLVYCIGKLPLEAIIKKVQVNKGPRFTLYWHMNSCSMAGSGLSYLFSC